MINLQLEFGCCFDYELAIAYSEHCLHLCRYIMGMVYVKLDLAFADQFHFREFLLITIHT